MMREQFVNGAKGYGSHRPLLWEALEATKDSQLPVIELGAGDSSTSFLIEYCKENKRRFFSCDSQKEWADKYGSIFISDWDKMNWNTGYSVCLLDLSPGDYRKIALMKIRADIIVIHDSEPPGWNASDYKVRPLFSKFKYLKDDVPKEKGAPWTSALSNTIDVTKFIL